ncbi:hypothetical protein L3Q82_008026 [Scortum barcoo]|uniref:Uncharacterized protein n=1 Tax=Scortum barcoo TaxID=214431 RepID=A0ACB8WK23_9TELE|nr:hypothetical protein L3Q82_008026 [Scortum barcoo]
MTWLPRFSSYLRAVTTCQLLFLAQTCTPATAPSPERIISPPMVQLVTVSSGHADLYAHLSSWHQHIRAATRKRRSHVHQQAETGTVLSACRQPASQSRRTVVICSVVRDPTHSDTPCLITYWRHGSWLDAISCPLCRQKVSMLCHLFNESRSDRQSKELLGEITDYNKRYSGAPRRVTDYLCDAPLLLQLLARGLGTMGGLVWLFFFRVALCCVGTVVSISSPPLDPVSSSANPLETDPSLCGLLGVLDDLVVVILLLTCVININQQMAPDRGHSANAATSQGVIGSSL